MVDTETSTTSCGEAVIEIENRQHHQAVSEGEWHLIHMGVIIQKYDLQ